MNLRLLLSLLPGRTRMLGGLHHNKLKSDVIFFISQNSQTQLAQALVRIPQKILNCIRQALIVASLTVSTVRLLGRAADRAYSASKQIAEYKLFPNRMLMFCS
jgi:hypothetical protein